MGTAVSAWELWAFHRAFKTASFRLPRRVDTVRWTTVDASLRSRISQYNRGARSLEDGVLGTI